MDTLFNMIIVGMTACGKTHYLLELLEKDYMNHFEFIILLCPTFEWNKTYREWEYINDPDFLTIPCDHGDIDVVLGHVADIFKGTNSLIILDDCADGKEVKNRTSEIVRLGFSARHYGLSTIVITQQLTSIAKPYTENVSKLVTFYTANRSDMKAVVGDYLNGVDKVEISRIIEQLKTHRYARLEINLKHPYGYVVRGT